MCISIELEHIVVQSNLSYLAFFICFNFFGVEKFCVMREERNKQATKNIIA